MNLPLFTYAQERRERPEPPRYPVGIPADVCDLFETLAFDLIRAGARRYSSDAILGRIRWHHHVERKDRTFKANDHWTAPLARWFLNKHPEHDGFFELRRSPHEGA